MDFIHKYEAFKGKLVEVYTLVMEDDEPVQFVGVVEPNQINPASVHLFCAVRVDKLEDILNDDSVKESDNLKFALATKGGEYILSNEHVWGMRSLEQKTVERYQEEKGW